MDLLAQTELAPTIIETAVESGLAQVILLCGFVLSSSELIQHSLPLHGVVHELLTAVPCVVCAVTCAVRQQRALMHCNAVRQYILKNVEKNLIQHVLRGVLMQRPRRYVVFQVIRNEILLLLVMLTHRNQEMQKIVAFEAN